MKKSIHYILLLSMGLVLLNVIGCASYPSESNVQVRTVAVLKSASLEKGGIHVGLNDALQKVGVSAIGSKIYSQPIETIQKAIIPTIESFDEKPNIFGGNANVTANSVSMTLFNQLYKKGRAKLIKFTPKYDKPVVIVASYKETGFIIKKTHECYIYTISEPNGDTSVTVFQVGNVTYSPDDFFRALEQNM